MFAQFSSGPEIPGARSNTPELGVVTGNKKYWALGRKLGKFSVLGLGEKVDEKILDNNCTCSCNWFKSNLEHKHIVACPKRNVGEVLTCFEVINQCCSLKWTTLRNSRVQFAANASFLLCKLLVLYFVWVAKLWSLLSLCVIKILRCPTSNYCPNAAAVEIHPLAF